MYKYKFPLHIHIYEFNFKCIFTPHEIISLKGEKIQQLSGHKNPLPLKMYL